MTLMMTMMTIIMMMMMMILKRSWCESFSKQVQLHAGKLVSLLRTRSRDDDDDGDDDDDDDDEKDWEECDWMINIELTGSMCGWRWVADLTKHRSAINNCDNDDFNATMIGIEYSSYFFRLGSEKVNEGAKKS